MNIEHFALITKYFLLLFKEIDELMKQIYAAHVSAQSAFTLPDLSAALKQIQSQYDDIAAKNLQVKLPHSSSSAFLCVLCCFLKKVFFEFQEMDSWYKNKFEDLTKKTSRHVDKVRSFRDEMTGAKKDVSIRSENK